MPVAPFNPTRITISRAFGGTGLGLSLAKSYVVAHGGFLWLESPEESGDSTGSAFTFSLPAVPEELDDYVGSHGDELTKAAMVKAKAES